MNAWLTRDLGTWIPGSIFCALGLALGIGLPLYHPDARASLLATVFAVLIGTLFFLAGLTMVVNDTRWAGRARPVLARLGMTTFAAVLLVAPWVEAGGSLGARIGFGILGGIMALFLLAFAVKRRKPREPA